MLNGAYWSGLALTKLLDLTSRCRWRQPGMGFDVADFRGLSGVSSMNLRMGARNESIQREFFASRRTHAVVSAEAVRTHAASLRAN